MSTTPPLSLLTRPAVLQPCNRVAGKTEATGPRFRRARDQERSYQQCPAPQRTRGEAWANNGPKTRVLLSGRGARPRKCACESSDHPICSFDPFAAHVSLVRTLRPARYSQRCSVAASSAVSPVVRHSCWVGSMAHLRWYVSTLCYVAVVAVRACLLTATCVEWLAAPVHVPGWTCGSAWLSPGASGAALPCWFAACLPSVVLRSLCFTRIGMRPRSTSGSASTPHEMLFAALPTLP